MLSDGRLRRHSTTVILRPGRHICKNPGGEFTPRSPERSADAACPRAASAWGHRPQPIIRRMKTYIQSSILALVLAAGAAFQCYYDFRVTGDWKTMPYVEHIRQYDMAPVLWVAHPAPPKAYRTRALELYHAGVEMEAYRSIREHWQMGWIERSILLMRPIWLLGVLLAVAALAGLFLSDRTLRLLSTAFFCIMAAGCLETWVQRHYFAPVFALTVLITCRLAWRVRRMARPFGNIAAVAIVLACLWPEMYRSFLGEASEVKHHLLDQAKFPYVRAVIHDRLVRQGGLHLIVVRYGPSHQPAGREWVYNGANIDQSPVIWAGEMTPDNSRLFNYFRGRKFWCLEADVKPYALKPCGAPAP